MAWWLRGFGACALAAALRLKVAQAAFSERALWVVRAGAECLCEFAFFASSPQPALVRVAARGQPSGHLASGGGANGGGEVADFAVEAERKRRRGSLEAWQAGVAERARWSFSVDRASCSCEGVAREAYVVIVGKDIGSSCSLSRLKAGESGASQHFF